MAISPDGSCFIENSAATAVPCTLLMRVKLTARTRLTDNFLIIFMLFYPPSSKQTARLLRFSYQVFRLHQLMSFSPRSLFLFGRILLPIQQAGNELYTMNCSIMLRRATHFVVSITYRLVNLPTLMVQAIIRGFESNFIFIFNVFICRF